MKTECARERSVKESIHTWRDKLNFDRQKLRKRDFVNISHFSDITLRVGSCKPALYSRTPEFDS
jgi:hypothetical protein